MKYISLYFVKYRSIFHYDLSSSLIILILLLQLKSYIFNNLCFKQFINKTHTYYKLFWDPTQFTKLKLYKWKRYDILSIPQRVIYYLKICYKMNNNFQFNFNYYYFKRNCGWLVTFLLFKVSLTTILCDEIWTMYLEVQD